MGSHTNDFDVDGGTGSSQFVLQSHFVLSGISMEAAVNLQVTGSILLPVGRKHFHQTDKHKYSGKFRM